jgi:hypothetical protein
MAYEHVWPLIRRALTENRSNPRRPTEYDAAGAATIARRA